MVKELCISKRFTHFDQINDVTSQPIYLCIYVSYLSYLSFPTFAISLLFVPTTPKNTHFICQKQISISLCFSTASSRHRTAHPRILRVYSRIFEAGRQAALLQPRRPCCCCCWCRSWRCCGDGQTSDPRSTSSGSHVVTWLH